MEVAKIAPAGAPLLRHIGQPTDDRWIAAQCLFL